MAYKINIENFEGPLDLLLFFIQRDKLNIYDIPISEITNDFLDYISYLNKKNIDIGADFIYMASLLMNIKSKMLLPNEVLEDEESIDPRQDLMLKLIDYKKYKNISIELSKVMINYSSTHRTFIEPIENTKNSYAELSSEELNLYDLIKTYAHLIDKINDKSINYEINFEEISVTDQILFIKNILKNKSKISFSNLIKNFDSKVYLIYTFIAILEMIKNKEIRIEQKTIFSEFYIQGVSK